MSESGSLPLFRRLGSAFGAWLKGGERDASSKPTELPTRISAAPPPVDRSRNENRISEVSLLSLLEFERTRDGLQSKLLAIDPTIEFLPTRPIQKADGLPMRIKVSPETVGNLVSFTGSSLGDYHPTLSKLKQSFAIPGCKWVVDDEGFAVAVPED